MSYKYYCTYCGRAVSQETVLYDMHALLTGDDKTDLQILKFRLTGNELRALYNQGKPVDLGYRRCMITLGRLMAWIANQNNLDEPSVANLSVADIVDYTTVVSMIDTAPKPKKKPKGIFDDDLDEEEEEEPKPAEKEAPKQRSAAILALEAKDEAIKNKVFSEELLKNELLHLNNRFIFYNTDTGEKMEKAFVFDIKLNTDKDNDGEDILTGFLFRNGPTVLTVPEARVCPFCGDKIFEHAGTAEHRLITFIGDQSSGKTCTILALTHYAQNAMYMQAMSDDPIWAGSDHIGSIATVELLSTEERLWADLRRYGNGLAPAKTAVLNRLDAYSATFRIRNKGQSKNYLVTLIDLPGELCKENGSIDSNRILNTFQVALACDVFVLCFDSTTAVAGKAVNMITKVCSWGNKFQELRAQFKAAEQGAAAAKNKTKPSDDCFAPIMVLFTKCQELESGAHTEAVQVPKTALKRAYVFAEEKVQIDGNEVYQRVGEQMRNYDHLKDVYTASLRCSPYGFAAPKEEDVRESKATNLDENGNVFTPRPIHVPQLMRWLMSVAGCIPTDAVFRPDLNPKSPRVYPPDSSYNFILRPQYLPQIPDGEGKDGDLKEALNRCYLFEAPGNFDWEYLQNYDNKTILKGVRIRARLKGKQTKLV